MRVTLSNIGPRASRWLACWLALCLAPAAWGGPPMSYFEWFVPLGRYPSFGKNSSPAIAPDGTIYIGCMDGDLYALEPNGHLKWQFHTERDVDSSPAIAADGTIYFGSLDRHLYAVTPEGQLKWRVATGWCVDASPAIGSDGTVYCGSWDHQFYAVTPEGRVKWTAATGGPILSSAAIGRNGRIYVGSDDGKLRAFSPDGREAWSFATGGPIQSSPAICADDAVCFTSTDGRLYLVETDGRLRWQLATGGWTDSSPVLDAQGRIYVGFNRQLWSVSAEGRKLWAFTKPNALLTSSPAVTESNLIYIASRDADIYGVNTNGELATHWEQLISRPRSSPNLLPGGAVVVGGRDYMLFALRAQGNPAASSWPLFRGNRRHTGNAADPP